MKALTTGLSLAPKADWILVVTVAELPETARLALLKYPSWICVLVDAQKLKRMTDQMGAVYAKLNTMEDGDTLDGTT